MRTSLHVLFLFALITAIPAMAHAQQCKLVSQNDPNITLSIQAGLNNLGNPNLYACIEFGPGTFNVPSINVNLPYAAGYRENVGLTIKGAGADTTILIFPGGNSGITINMHSPITQTVNISDLSIVTSNTPSSPGGVGIDFSGPSDNNVSLTPSRITNVHIRSYDPNSVAFSYGIWLDSVANVIIDHVFLQNNIDSIVVSGNTSTVTRNIKLSNSTLSGSSVSDTAIYIGQGVSEFQGSQLTVSGHQYGLRTLSSSGTATPNVNITNSHFLDQTINAIYTPVNINHLALSNNFIRYAGSSQAIVYLSAVVSYTITGNTFNCYASCPNTAGIRMDNTGTVAGVITGNDFENLKTGVYMGSSARYVIVNSNGYVNMSSGNKTQQDPSASNNTVGVATP